MVVIRLFLGLLVAGALAMPQTLEAATTKKKTTASKPAARKSSSSSAGLRKIGNGPLGPLVDAPNQQVFANIGGFALGTATVGYERALSDDNSWTAQLGFRSQGGGGFSVNYIGLIGSYRWWLGEHAKMQGFYAGPFGAAQMVNINYDSTTISGFTVTTKKETANSFIFGAGGEGGYQWILPMGLTLGVGLNMGYYFGSLSLGSGAPSIPFGGFGTGLNGTVGYAF